MKLDYTSLQKAISQLELSMSYAQSDMAAKDTQLFIQFRSACIQAFEYSYELCIKMLKRQLETMEASSDTIDNLTYRDLIRVGAEKGLIKNVNAWFEFKSKRNLTVHTYNEAKAGEVYNALGEFVIEASLLINRLKALN